MLLALLRFYLPPLLLLWGDDPVAQLHFSAYCFCKHLHPYLPLSPLLPLLRLLHCQPRQSPLSLINAGLGWRVPVRRGPCYNFYAWEIERCPLLPQHRPLKWM
jgi:hypothetical protein